MYWALPVPQAGAEHARATSPFILTTVLLDQFSYYFHSVDEKTEFKSFSINSVKVLTFKLLTEVPQLKKIKIKKVAESLFCLVIEDDQIPDGGTAGCMGRDRVRNEMNLDHIATNSWWISSPWVRINVANRMAMCSHTHSQESKGIDMMFLCLHLHGSQQGKGMEWRGLRCQMPRPFWMLGSRAKTSH